MFSSTAVWQTACKYAAGLRADEAKSINMSLTMLGMCIYARASSATAHAPYRDSKLTRLLKARAMQSTGSNVHLLPTTDVLVPIPR